MIFDNKRLDPGIYGFDYKKAALKPVVLKDRRIEEGWKHNIICEY